ncbi:hypothetical protein ACVBEE_00460 [Acinetobacter sp. ANC 3781]
MNAQTQNMPVQSQQSVGLLNLESFELSQRIAKMLSNSTLVPEQYRATIKVKAGKDSFGNMVYRDEPNPNGLSNCVIALNMSNRMGADPLMVMQNLYLIEGRPAWSSQFIMAAINSCGRFSALRFELVDLGEKEVEYTTTEWVDRKKSTIVKKVKIQDMSCVAFAIERETGERIESSKITIEMAVKEGWYGKNGSKWQTMPEQMLRYRAASFFGRVYAPELLMGLRSADEEQDRIIDVTPEKDVSEQTDTNQLKREILGAKSPAALDEAENKVLMLSDDAKREELLKIISAQGKKFQPAAEVATAKKPEAVQEEIPPVEVQQVKKPTSADVKKSFAKALNNAKSERGVAAIESQIDSSFDLSESDKKQLAVNVQQMYEKFAPEPVQAEEQPAADNLSVNELQRLQAEAEKLVAQKEETKAPEVNEIKSQMAKNGLKNQIASAPSVEALKEIAATVRDYKLKLTNDDMGEVLADYAARKTFLENQQDMFAEVEEVSYVDAVIKRIQNAKSQDDINAEYSDPAFDELSAADRDRIDKEAQLRESELQD